MKLNYGVKTKNFLILLMHAKGVMNVLQSIKMSVHAHKMQPTNNHHNNSNNSIHKVVLIVVGKDQTIFVRLMLVSIYCSNCKMNNHSFDRRFRRPRDNQPVGLVTASSNQLFSNPYLFSVKVLSQALAMMGCSLWVTRTQVLM